MLNSRRFLPLLVLVATPAWAQENEQPDLRASLSLERHVTANALESSFPLTDWYTALRGSIERTLALENGKITLGAAMEAKRFDTYEMEDDRGVTLSASAEQRVGNRLELRGSIGWMLSSEGDDLALQDTIIGIRTVTETFLATAQAGIDLGKGFALVIDAGVMRETPRPTRFEADIAEPQRLTPRKDRLELAAKLGRTAGSWTLAGTAGSEFVAAGRQGHAPYRFSLSRHKAVAEAKWTSETGIGIGGAIGAEYLTAVGGALSDLRPTYALALELPVRSGIALRASLAAGFDTRNTDDPVASWLERREIEASLPLGEKLTFGVGLYSSWREYLSLGGGEKAHGAYSELSYALAKPVTVTFRVDASTARFIGTDTEIPRLDAYLGLRANM